MKTTTKHINEVRSKLHLLIIDDDPGFYDVFRSKYQGIYAFDFSSTPGRGLELIGGRSFDAILLDLNYQGKYSYEEGLSFILPRAIKLADNKCPVLVLTADSTRKTRLKAIEMGAAACISKGDCAANGLNQVIRDTLEEFQNGTIAKTAKPKLSSTLSIANDGFLAISPYMQELKGRLRTAAEFPEFPILLLGETGVGKEVAARYLHNSKPNASKLPFVDVNLSSFSPGMERSEMFGHLKGSFTGAINDHEGYFEKAKDGTLFLDDIGEISLDLQISLLRVFEEKKFSRLGSTKNINLGAHLVFATNKDLETAKLGGEFREDFFQRLGYVIQIPPLRDRKEEIIPLINYFLETLCAKNGHPLFGKNAEKAFAKPTLELLLNYHWPGNIRELRQMIQSTIIETAFKGKSIVDPELLPQRFFSPPTLFIDQKIQNEEKVVSTNNTPFNWRTEQQTAFNQLSRIEQVLISTGGRKDEAAKSVGIKNDQLLRYKIKSYYAKYPDLFDNFPIVFKLYKFKK